MLFGVLNYSRRKSQIIARSAVDIMSVTNCFNIQFHCKALNVYNFESNLNLVALTKYNLYFQAQQIQLEQNPTARRRRHQLFKQNVIRLKVKNALKDIFTALEKAFVFGGPIQEVVFSIGSTIRSPKELYLLRFPLGFHDGPSATKSQCISKLFRKIVSSNFLDEKNCAKPGSKLTVLILAPRNCKVCCEQFIPKLSYKLPHCTRYVIELICRAPVASAELSHVDSWNCDVSGIEPLESSVAAMSINDNSIANAENTAQFACNVEPTTLFSNASGVHYVTSDNSSQSEQMTECYNIDVGRDDFVWFQMPVCVDGYVDKITKESNSSIFMI